MGNSESSRRRRTLRGVLSEAVRAARTPAPPRSGYYIKLGRAAMACQFEVILRPQDRRFIPAVVEALDEVELLERQMSVYREDSEVSRINRTAASGPVEVEARLYRLLRLARHIGIETAGAFDITTGALIRAWGFMQRSGAVPEAGRFQAARAGSGWEHLELDDASRTVSFRRAGVELNLGAIGKGFALDCLAGRLRAAGLANFMAHAGHSSIVGRGDSASPPGWQVSIRAPGGAGSLGSIRLVDRSISTSAAGTQFFVSEGRCLGHILDPRSGRPAERNALCSVLAPEAAVAEAFSTAFFVLAETEVRSYFTGHPELGIILVILQENGNPGAPVALGADLTCTEEAL